MSPLQADEHARDVVTYLNHAPFWRPSPGLEHGAFAFWLMDMIRPKSLELGTHSGFAFVPFCQAARRLGLPTACYVIDIWAEDEPAFHGQEIYDQLAAISAQYYGDFAQRMHSGFDEALPHFAEGTVDLPPIDGGRGYQEVRTALETWQPKFSARAVVLLRHINVRDRAFGVWRLWGEADPAVSFEFLHGHGLGVLAVGAETPQTLAPLFAASAGQAIHTAYARCGGAIRQDTRLTKPGRNANYSCASSGGMQPGCGPRSGPYGWKAVSAGSK